MIGSCVKILPLLVALSGSGLEDRMAGLHGILSRQALDSYTTRESIKGYFLSDDDLSNFIVALLHKMMEGGYEKRTINSWTVRDLELKGDEGRADVMMKGKGWLFFTATLEFREEWVKRGGEWFLLPPRILSPRR